MKIKRAPILPSEDLKAVGLDLATTTGWASIANGVVVSGIACFKNEKRDGQGMRYLRFLTWLKATLDIEKPDIVYYEDVHRHLSTAAAHAFGGFRAIMQAELERREIPYLPLEIGAIKRFATGNWRAKKPAMIAAAKRQWPDRKIVDDNEADALWILACGTNRKNQ